MNSIGTAISKAAVGMSAEMVSAAVMRHRDAVLKKLKKRAAKSWELFVEAFKQGYYGAAVAS